jgi:hypothetical protein
VIIRNRAPPARNQEAGMAITEAGPGMALCPTCHGAQKLAGGRLPCPVCNGKGQVPAKGAPPQNPANGAAAPELVPAETRITPVPGVIMTAMPRE